jgi:hypothetical protein
MLGRRRLPDLGPPSAEELGPPVSELDRQLLEELQRVGADLSQPRDTRFFLYFASEADAESAASAVARLDFETDVEWREDVPSDEAWRVVAWRDMVVDEPEIARVRRELGAIVVRNWGSLGGWEAAVQL